MARVLVVAGRGPRGGGHAGPQGAHPAGAHGGADGRAAVGAEHVEEVGLAARVARGVA